MRAGRACRQATLARGQQGCLERSYHVTYEKKTAERQRRSSARLCVTTTMSRTESAAAVARGEDVREDTQNVETSVFTEDDQQILDLDSEVITDVHLDGMALMKMIKHCKDCLLYTSPSPRD